MNDEELGLPTPDEPEVDDFTVLDYLGEEYAEARTLEEAIDIRGADAFFQDMTADEFADDSPSGMKKIGTAELWAESTWRKGESDRHLLVESLAAEVKEGDMLEVRQCPDNLSEWGYVFLASDGTILPFSPYHDYDDVFFLRVLQSLRSDERVLCSVKETSCVGQDGIDEDPEFCWRVYSCKLMVYRAARLEDSEGH